MDKNVELTLCEILSSISSFDGLDLRGELSAFSFKALSPKEFIFSEGDTHCDVSIVIEGIGRYFCIDIEGGEKNKALIRKGGVFASASSIVEGKPSPFFAQAITRCTIASIPYCDLVALGSRCHSWNTFLRKLLERILLRMEKRKTDLLMLSAKQRYLDFLREFGTDAEHISLRQIAMYVGITDVSLSRIRKELGLT